MAVHEKNHNKSATPPPDVMTSLNLEKFAFSSDDDGGHVFTFIFNNPQRLLEMKCVESSEVLFGGHRWSLVCMRKDERFMGVFLKWKYSDGQTAASVSAKAKYSICLIHRHDYTCNKYFNSSQKFTSSQSMLGKSKFVPLADLLDPPTGYLDETGTRLILELSMSRISSRFERTIDISPKARNKKNSSGYFYDTPVFTMASYKWYLRTYPCKINSNGLPAIYLYLSSKPHGINIDVLFRLYIGHDMTETLAYNFGEGAKFDGFGKTLPRQIYQIELQNDMVVGVEVDSVVISKDVLLPLRTRPQAKSPHGILASSPAFRHLTSKSLSGIGTNSFTPQAETFQDMEGNYWTVEFDKNLSQRLSMTFNKGHQQYAQNRTKVLCWTGTLLSRDPNAARDIEMNGEPNVGYFSNFIEEKGYIMTFPIEKSDLESTNSMYSTDNGEVVLRVTFLSLQSVPTVMRSTPKFEYQTQHLLKARKVILEKQKNLEDMREMSASRASLTQLDLSHDTSQNRVTSDSGSDTGSRSVLYKSLENLEMAVANGGDLMHQNLPESDTSRGFFSDFLQFMSHSTTHDGPDRLNTTSRDVFHGARVDSASQMNGVRAIDDHTLFEEARASPVELAKHKETVDALVMFLQQKLPFRVNEILESGSLGTGTCTKSRSDVDLIIYSQSLPRENQEKWISGLLHAISNHIQNHSLTQDPFFPISKCSFFGTTATSLQFTCGGVDVDIMLSYDWCHEESAGYEALYNIACKEPSKTRKFWNSLGSARLQKKFIAEQPNEVKELIKVVKHWRNCVRWRKSNHRPNSYLLSLLVVKASEDARSFDMKTVFNKVGLFINAPELSLSWSKYYASEKFKVEFDPPAPLVRDPANPGYNVADSLPYWGEFRTEFNTFLPSISTAPTLI